LHCARHLYTHTRPLSPEAGARGASRTDTEFGGVPLAVEEDEAPGPVGVAVLGAAGVVADAQDVAELVEQARAVAAGPRDQAAAGALRQVAGGRAQLAQRLGQHDCVEEGEGRTGLDLGRRGQVGPSREVVEEGGHLGSGQVARVADLVEEDIASDPIDLGLAEGGDHLVEEPGRAWRKGSRSRHGRSPPGRQGNGRHGGVYTGRGRLSAKKSDGPVCS
jgi:hypothetical protein